MLVAHCSSPGSSKSLSESLSDEMSLPEGFSGVQVYDILATRSSSWRIINMPGEFRYIE